MITKSILKKRVGLAEMPQVCVEPAIHPHSFFYSRDNSFFYFSAKKYTRLKKTNNLDAIAAYALLRNHYGYENGFIKDFFYSNVAPKIGIGKDNLIEKLRVLHKYGIVNIDVKNKTLQFISINKLLDKRKSKLNANKERVTRKKIIKINFTNNYKKLKKNIQGFALLNTIYRSAHKNEQHNQNIKKGIVQKQSYDNYVGVTVECTGKLINKSKSTGARLINHLATNKIIKSERMYRYLFKCSFKDYKAMKSIGEIKPYAFFTKYGVFEPIRSQMGFYSNHNIEWVSNSTISETKLNKLLEGQLGLLSNFNDYKKNIVSFDDKKSLLTIKQIKTKYGISTNQANNEFTRVGISFIYNSYLGYNISIPLYKDNISLYNSTKK